MSEQLVPRWRETVDRPPTGWRRCTFGDVFRERCEAGNSDLPLLSVTRERGVVRHSETARRDRSSSDKSTYLTARRGDLAYNSMRMWQGVSGLVGEDGIVSPAYTVLEPRAGNDPAFLSYLLRYRPLVDVFRAYSQGLVDDTLTLRFSELARLPAVLPPLAEQRKIATILSSVDETIEKTEAVIAQLDVVKKAMLEELLTRGIPGRHSRFKETELGGVPEEWRIARVREIAKVVRGSSPRPAGDPRYFNGEFIPWITVGEITRDSWPYLEGTSTSLTREGQERSRLLRRGVVVLTNSGATLGVPKILRIDGCANDGVAALLELSADIDPLFIYYRLLRLTEALRRDVARGVGQPNLNTDLIGDLLLPVPSQREQLDIAAALFAIDDRIRQESVALSKCVGVKSALTSVLLTGVVRVGMESATA